ncbi:hypothetical protein NQ317_007437 [Molorchus minor]|uniref:Carboxypeptidase n=1 Tax=Molorchus minor TaxID=1323400 RepID=A0ABQ9JGF6_9CUCU|nr:hypothetical protein NQ317_007437 [Molorchus minor]
MTVPAIKKLVFVNTILLFCLQKVLNYQLFNVYGNVHQKPIVGDPGKPLFLTPLIEQNKIKQAKQSARVNPDKFLGVKSYSGYLTVSDFYDSNLFFWFFPSENNYERDPVILWLQGMIGGTSLFGLFMENGPFSLNADLQLVPRNYSWTKNHSVLYIDNPVGSGYSFTNGGYAKNQTQIGKDLYNALQQFFKLFSELRENDFFIIGESYAGKYVPAIGYTILKENPKAKSKINLRGTGYSDPIHQIDYSDYLYQLGILDWHGKKLFKEKENKVAKLITEEKYVKALHKLPLNTKLMYNTTGYENLYNYLQPQQRLDLDILFTFVQRAAVRAAIHVGDSRFSSGFNVYRYLESDIMKSVAPWISELLSNYRMLFYNGQLDIVCAYPMMENVFYNLNFDAAEQYKTARRVTWSGENDLLLLKGYIKHSGNLTEAFIRAAGHFVPIDQPESTYDLIHKFIRNELPH